MTVLTRFVLDHKRLVFGFWLAVTIAAFATIGRERPDALFPPIREFLNETAHLVRG